MKKGEKGGREGEREPYYCAGKGCGGGETGAAL